MNILPQVTCGLLATVAFQSAGPWTATENAQLAASEPEFAHFFGWSVAVSGDTAVVGDHDNFAEDLGLVHVFERDQGGPDAWGQTAVLMASNGTPGDLFGYAVDNWGDTILVGAYSVQPHWEVNDLYVFERDSSAASGWSEVAILFGGSVNNAIWGDTIIAGSNPMQVYQRDQGGPGAWGQVAELQPSDPEDWGYGEVALHGDTAVVGSWFAGGQIYVFERNAGGPNAWGETFHSGHPFSDPETNTGFAGECAIWEDTIFVAAMEANTVCVYERTNGQWGLNGQLTPSALVPQEHEWGISLDAWGDTLLVASSYVYGGDNSGFIYALQRNEGGADAWGEVLKWQVDGFGRGCAVSGNTALVGAYSSDHGNANVNQVSGLAFDPLANVFYGVTSYDWLLTIDPGSGADTLVGKVPFSDVQGLAFDPGTGTLYGSDKESDKLIAIDTTTALATEIGPLGFPNVYGLDFDSTTGTLYGINENDGGGMCSLITIDTSTGVGTKVGNVGFQQVHGLAFDPSSNTLFACAEVADNLLTIDVTTGTGTAVGPLGFDHVAGLAFDSLAGVLAGTDLFSGEFLAIDTVTGAGTSILSGIENAGHAYVYELDFTTQNYCTAGTSASGCQALLSASGTASATAANGFTLTAATVEGLKDGAFFYGANGQQALPWGNGSSFQCVVPPLTRTGRLAGSGTAGQCDGSFTRDFNAFWCPTCVAAAKNPGAGAMVLAQLWYRDPQNTSNQKSSLSDAIEFLVLP